jgi:hypothetical protein
MRCLLSAGSVQVARRNPQRPRQLGDDRYLEAAAADDDRGAARDSRRQQDSTLAA